MTVRFLNLHAISAETPLKQSTTVRKFQDEEVKQSGGAGQCSLRSITVGLRTAMIHANVQ